MEILLSASAGENLKFGILCGTFIAIFTVALQIKHIFIGTSTTLNLIDWLCLKKTRNSEKFTKRTWHYKLHISVENLKIMLPYYFCIRLVLN